METQTQTTGLLKARDVATWLSVSKSWVYREAAAYRLPSVKAGGALRFTAGDVAAFLAANTRKGVVAKR